MKFDKNYDLPEGTVEADLNVSQKLNTSWVGLRRVTVVRFENGKEENIGGLTCAGSTEDQGPENDPEEILDAIYRLGYMKSSELGRSIQCRVKYFVQGRNNPHSAIFSVTSPELTTGREAQDDETVQALAGQEGAYGAIALATLRSQQVHINATERTLNLLQTMLLDANNRLDNAQNRESAVAQMLVDAHMRDVGREDKVYATLDNALQATIDNARMFGEIHRREMTIDLELERARLKADGTTAFIKEIGGQLSAAVPLLMMAGMAKLTDADPGAIAAMMGGMGGAIPGAPVKTGGAPPPPAPRSRPVTRGHAPASAPVTRPRVAPMPTAAPAAPAAAPAVSGPPMPINPGEGVGALSAEIGESITAMQWGQFTNLLAPEQVQRLRDWLSPNPQTDQEAIGAMLRCVQVQKIANAISQVVTNDQGLQLDALLDKVYASMGVVRPSTSESVQSGPSDQPTLTVVDSGAAHRSGAAANRSDSSAPASNPEDSESSGEDAESSNRSDSGAMETTPEDAESEDADDEEDFESEDTESENEEDFESDDDADAESEEESSPRSTKKVSASESKKATKKAHKKVSASKSKKKSSKSRGRAAR